MRSKQSRFTYAMSKRRKTGIIALCLLAVMLLAWADRGSVARRLRAPHQSGDRAKDHDREKYHGRVFTVARAIDGDTFDIDVPDGGYEHTRVRLLGIDTPEINSEQFGTMYFGPQAAAVTRELAFGKPVTVYLDEPNPTRGKYGRLLAYVQLPDGRFLNEALLTEGLAYADLRFDHSFYNKYNQLEAGTRNLKKGLWQNVTRNQLPEWLQRMNPKLLNK
ncbi:MAG: thermonuclease family protein [Planctomycetota bacterium]